MILMAYLSYMLAEVSANLALINILRKIYCHFVLCRLMWRSIEMQLLYLSGILTVFFCGIVMSHYTWHNVTESSRITTRWRLSWKFSKSNSGCSFPTLCCFFRHIFATLSFIAETFIFLYVGMDALDKDKWNMTDVRCGNCVTRVRFSGYNGSLFSCICRKKFATYVLTLA